MPDAPTPILKPCPFCGAPAEVLTSQDESLFSHDVVTWYEIRCVGPWSLFDEFQLDCPGYAGIHSENLDELAGAWNHRAVQWPQQVIGVECGPCPPPCVCRALVTHEGRCALCSSGLHLVMEEEMKAAAERLDRAAERLVLAMHIYPNYRLDSRGPRGCIADALEGIATRVLAEVQQTSWDAVYQRRWAEPEEGASAEVDLGARRLTLSLSDLSELLDANSMIEHGNSVLATALRERGIATHRRILGELGLTDREVTELDDSVAKATDAWSVMTQPSDLRCGGCGCPQSAHVGLGGGCLASRGGCDRCDRYAARRNS